MAEISLAGTWQATWGDGLHGKFAHFLMPLADPARYLPMEFPGSIQANLTQAGILEDPRLSTNSLKARWVEEHFWILRKTFDVPEEAPNQTPHLHIDILDGVARAALNGIVVGEHANANRPATFDLSGALLPGKNELVILLESGLFKVADLPGADYAHDETSWLNKRHHLRQPQFQFGWDWNPRLVFFGMHGNMQLVWGIAPRLGQISVTAEVTPDLERAHIRVRSAWFVPGSTAVTISLQLTSLDGLSVQSEYRLQAGTSEVETSLEILNPRLWWPRGYGEPFLYPLQLEAFAEGHLCAAWQGQTGLRRVELNQPPHPEEGNYFHILINNQPVFCKGANWVPPEMSAFEVDPAKVQQLVELAVEQNFNMLRLWGGAVWAGHHLLNLCDQHGLMVWHDLLFACSKYPVDNPSFLAEVQTEIAWGLREFSPHPSLVLWCGNNEMEEGLWSWGFQNKGRTAPDFVLFHHIIPMLRSQIDTTRPYWPSSPYSSPDVTPQNPTRGDQHPWSVSLHSDEHAADFWNYRKFIDRFPNEGGVLGISPAASLQQFLDPEEYRLRSFAWEHHDNTVSFWYPRPGVGYAALEYWLGKRAEILSLDELALASGLLQAEGLKEYIRNYRRRWPSTSAAIYWDYTDSWPSVHGWGTLDYYLRRKPAFHAVRRAFASMIVVLADLDDQVGVYLVNESPEPREVHLETGDFMHDGPREPRKELVCTVPPFSSQRITCLPRQAKRVYYALIRDPEGHLIGWDRMLLQRFQELAFTQPEITVETIETETGGAARYTSQHWVWSVVLDPDGDLCPCDDAFDLLPGVPYDVHLKGEEKAPLVKFSGNELMCR